MKLTEIAKIKAPVDWDLKSEKQQIAMVKRSRYGLRQIANPSVAVQLAGVEYDAWSILQISNPPEVVQLVAAGAQPMAIQYLNNPSSAAIKIALTHPSLVNNETWYKQSVETLFKDNAILKKKWLRYGESMREQK
jgi:hypothetical protein